MKTKILQFINNELLDQGGENRGCVVEPETFKQRIAEMDDAQLREVLNALEGYLWKTRQLWRSN